MDYYGELLLEQMCQIDYTESYYGTNVSNRQLRIVTIGTNVSNRQLRRVTIGTIVSNRLLLSLLWNNCVK